MGNTITRVRLPGPNLIVSAGLYASARLKIGMKVQRLVYQAKLYLKTLKLLAYQLIGRSGLFQFGGL